MSLQLHTCILPPDSHPFQHFVVSGALSKAGAPSLNVRLSTAQLRKLNAILDASQAEPNNVLHCDARGQNSATEARWRLVRNL